MLRKFACAIAILGMAVGIAMAEDVKGTITKISDTKVTIVVKSKEDKKGTAKDYDVAKDVKVSKSEGKDKKVAVPDGLKNEAFTKITDKKGLNATLVVEGGKVVEIVLGGGGKKKDAK